MQSTRNSKNPGKNPAAPASREFFERYGELLKEAYDAEQKENCSSLAILAKLTNANPSPDDLFRMASLKLMREEVEKWWPIRVLQQLAEERDVEGSKHFLSFFLGELNVRLPKGVLLTFQAKRGRPQRTRRIWLAWAGFGKPQLTGRVCDDLARIFYPSEFVRAQSQTGARKKLRDRVRATVLRHLRVVNDRI